MKFNVVIGNPPYQQMDGGSGSSARPLYPYFVDISERLSKYYVCLIIPARWYVGGKGLSKFRTRMLNDKHIKVMYDYADPQEVFPNVMIEGGLVIFLTDCNYNNEKDNVQVVNIKNGKKLHDSCRPMKTRGINIFLRNADDMGILKRLDFSHGTVKDIMAARNAFKFSSNYKNDPRCHDTPHGLHDPVKIIGKFGYVGFVERSAIQKHPEWVDIYKDFVPKANDIGKQNTNDNQNSRLGTPNMICTETYILVGVGAHLNHEAVLNLDKYLNTKFVRYLMTISKTTQDASRKSFRFVPLQDFTNGSDIDWSVSLHSIDKQLFAKYGLTKQQCHLILDSIHDRRGTYAH